MKIKKMAKLFECGFECYNVHVKVRPHGTMDLGVNKIYLLKLKPKSGTKIKRVFGCFGDIKTIINCSIFKPFVKNGNIYLAILPSPNTNKGAKIFMKGIC